MFCIVFFSFKTNFFFAKTRAGFEGVQRRGPVKGAAFPRSSKTLDREHRWNNAGLRRRGLSGEKMKSERLRLRTPSWRVWQELLWITDRKNT
jgi:hypothetical protein